MSVLTPSAITAIVFDKDGTLFDFGATWNAWAKAFLMRLADGHRDRAVALGQMIGFDLNAGVFAPDSFVIAGTPDELVETLAPECLHLSRDALFALINEEAAAAPMAETVPLAPLLVRLAGAGANLPDSLADCLAVGAPNTTPSLCIPDWTDPAPWTTLTWTVALIWPPFGLPRAG